MSANTSEIAVHPVAQRSTPAFVLAVVVALAAFAVLLKVFWVGFLGSDDSVYWAGASGWMGHFPFVGTTHHTLRHTIVLPLALVRSLLGDKLYVLFLPSLAYSAGIVVLLAIWMRRAAGMFCAAAALVLVVTNAVFLLTSATANIDVAETFFVLLAFVLLDAAMAREAVGTRSSIPLLVMAGVAAGLGMLSRETAIFGVFAVGLLFLGGYGLPRSRYVAFGIGFASVVLLEFAYLYAMTGNILYRLHISAHHDETVSRYLDQGASVPLIHPAIDPVTMVLFNHNFGVLGWAVVPIVVWLFRRGVNTPALRRFAVLATVLAATWAVAAAGFTIIPLLPRYFMLSSLLISAVCGVALARMWQRGGRRVPLLAGCVIVAANLLGVAADNRNFMFGEHVLVDVAAQEQGPIHTNTQTLRRADLLLDLANVRTRVTAAPPAPGELVFYDPFHTNEPAGADWQALQTWSLPPTIVQRVLQLVPGLSLPPRVWMKLGAGHPPVTLYRVPASG